MNNTYNNNMYLMTNSLNNIENDIKDLTDAIQYHIFDDQVSPLRNIVVGDNLNGRVLYLDIPVDFYNTYEQIQFIDIVTTNKNNNLSVMYSTNSVSGDTVMITKIRVEYHIEGYSYYYHIYDLYSYSENTNTNKSILQTNKKRFKLPMDFGVVTRIDTENDAYQYLKIYDDETIIPDYVKHTWSNNEFLSMQKIDNIEKGIDNIGQYYYKPVGWVNAREWLKTSTVENIDDNMNIQNISYQDLNRWTNNLNLINFDELDEMTIWNSGITQLEWDEQSDIEWEDL